MLDVGGDGVRDDFFASVDASSLVAFALPRDREVGILKVLFDSTDERWRTTDDMVPDMHKEIFDIGPRGPAHCRPLVGTVAATRLRVG